MAQKQDELTVCPYDKSHVIFVSHLQKHLLKCKVKHSQLATCPYNATHRVPFEEIDCHIKECTDKIAPQDINLLKINVPPAERKNTDTDEEEYWD